MPIIPMLRFLWIMSVITPIALITTAQMAVTTTAVLALAPGGAIRYAMIPKVRISAA